MKNTSTARKPWQKISPFTNRPSAWNSTTLSAQTPRMASRLRKRFLVAKWGAIAPVSQGGGYRKVRFTVTIWVLICAPMYIASIFLLTLILPAGSVYLDQAVFHSAQPILLLAGTWFVFWAGGVRLFVAGLRRMGQPRFTAEHIFGIGGDDPLPFIRELGMANLAMGTIGLLSLPFAGFLLPAAVTSGLYYALAGAFHVARKRHGAEEAIAMLSDLFVAIVVASYVV